MGKYLTNASFECDSVIVMNRNRFMILVVPVVVFSFTSKKPEETIGQRYWMYSIAYNLDDERKVQEFLRKKETERDIDDFVRKFNFDTLSKKPPYEKLFLNEAKALFSLIHIEDEYIPTLLESENPIVAVAIADETYVCKKKWEAMYPVKKAIEAKNGSKGE